MTSITNTPDNPSTGPTSTSWWVAMSAMLTALVPFVWTMITHQSPSTEQVTAIVAGVGAAIAVVTKIWHDVQRHQIAAALRDASAGVGAVRQAAAPPAA